MLYFLFMVLLFIMSLLCVAFTTLLERKMLGLSQNRISVNKTFLVGILQPMIDGLKLMFKSLLMPIQSMVLLWLLSPVILFVICMALWVGFFHSYAQFFSCWFLMLVWLFGVTVFGTMFSSMTSSSSYASMGAIRSACQTICFEVVFFTMICSILIMKNTLSCSSSAFPMLVFIWVPLILLELMRSPMDLPEGESELVSGYNIEYSSTGFVLLFLSEYSMIFIISVMSSLFFFDFSIFASFTLFIFFIFIRSVYVRLKADSLISLAWFYLLPLAIFLLMFFMFIF